MNFSVWSVMLIMALPAAALVATVTDGDTIKLAGNDLHSSGRRYWLNCWYE